MANDEYDNTNTGALFKNERKVKENQPDYTGSANIGGTEYWVSAWVKRSRAGKTFMSMAYTVKEDKPATTYTEVEGDDIPF